MKTTIYRSEKKSDMQARDGMKLADDEQLLKRIGLTEAAARCYIALIGQLPYARPASFVGDSLKLPDSTLFRALQELLAKGFVVYSNEQPRHRTYRAVSLSYALESYAIYQRQQVLPLLQKWASSGKITR